MWKRFSGRVVSALDSHQKAQSLIPGGSKSRISLSDLHSPLCRKVTVQVRRHSEGTLSHQSRMQGEYLPYVKN